VRDFDCMLLRDDRIGIVGANGSGKSTLLNLLAGELAPDAGAVETGETVRIGYFRQEVPDMDGDTRVIDYVKEIGSRIETGAGMLTASQLLEQFLFPAEVQWSPIRKLSGGEKRRLFLLSVLAAAPNVLLLDEPTNDLDIQTLSVLEDYLDSFPGAVVAVSHDRYFVNKFATRIWELENGHIRDFPCGYEKYRSIKEKEAIAAPAPEKPKKERKEKPKTSGSKMLEKQVRALEREIEKQEQLSAQLDTQIEAAASDYQELARLMAEKQSCDDALTGLMDEWERLSSDLEGAT